MAGRHFNRRPAWQDVSKKWRSSTKTGVICEIFFDTPAVMIGQRARPVADFVRSLQPACLVDGPLGVPGDHETMGFNRHRRF